MSCLPSPEDDDFNDLVIFGRRFIRDGAPDLTSFTTAFNAALPGALGDNASAVYEAAKVKFREAEDATLKDSTPTGVTNKIKGKRAEIADPQGVRPEQPSDGDCSARNCEGCGYASSQDARTA